MTPWGWQSLLSQAMLPLSCSFGDSSGSQVVPGGGAPQGMSSGGHHSPGMARQHPKAQELQRVVLAVTQAQGGTPN